MRQGRAVARIPGLSRLVLRLSRVNEGIFNGLPALRYGIQNARDIFLDLTRARPVIRFYDRRRLRLFIGAR